MHPHDVGHEDLGILKGQVLALSNLIYGFFGIGRLAVGVHLLERTAHGICANAMCRSFQQMNANGKSAYSKKSINKVAQGQNLTFQDAEILVTYVVGMHCPDVR